jgi:hypothetical protein
MKKEIAEQAGIDMKAGLRAFANNKIIYDRFLLGFAKDTHLADAETAYASGDTAKAVEHLEQLCALTQKLGMLQYHAAAGDVLAAVQAGDGAVAFDRARAEHDKVMAAFSA